MSGNSNSGRRPGRPCDWFLERCREILDEEKLLDFVGRVASGKETEQRVVVVRERDSARTEVVEVKCSTQDRLAAFKMLAEWGIGKPGLIASQITPEDSKRTADEYYQSIKRLEEDAVNRYRASTVRP